MRSVKYICFSLDFSCIMCFPIRDFFQRTGGGYKCPNPVGIQYCILFPVDPCTYYRALQQDTGITRDCIRICVSCQYKDCQRIVSFLPGHGRYVVQ